MCEIIQTYAFRLPIFATVSLSALRQVTKSYQPQPMHPFSAALPLFGIFLGHEELPL